jgi:hypothetical protein
MSLSRCKQTFPHRALPSKTLSVSVPNQTLAMQFKLFIAHAKGFAQTGKETQPDHVSLLRRHSAHHCDHLTYAAGGRLQ